MSDQRSLFDDWVSLNGVMFAYRSRFDALRDDFPACTTREEAQRLLRREGYDTRYPLLPDWLPEGG